MPVVPCKESSPCLDPSSPITNFSSEAPDQNEFLSLKWPPTDPNNPVGGGPGGPCQNCPPQTFTADGCGSECASTVSQAAADQCAAAQAESCLLQNNGNTIFLNRQQICFAFCPDGSRFTYTVAAGQFPAATQAAADNQAAAFACDALQAFMLCLPDIATEACINTAFSATITVSKGVPPFTMSVTGLPPGLSAAQTSNKSLVISGTPTMAGSFNFTVTATDQFGDFMTRVYTLCVVDITPGHLPDCTIGAAYSAQLSATACANQTQSWQVTSGSLPPGLSLDEQTGKITGTPTGPAGAVSFTVTFQDQSS